MKNGHQALLINGPIGFTLFRLTLPMMVGMIGMVIFNLVDTYFIGKLGTDEMAAMSFNLPVAMFIGCFYTGLGVGASAVISKMIGKGENIRVKRQTTDSILLALLVVIFLSIIGILTIYPLFSIIGAKDNIIELAKEYMVIWYIGLVIVVIPMIGNNAMRAAGNTIIPTVIMIVAVIANCILDPILIFGLR